MATKVYEKGPQTLTEAIREVEKLQATQQLTSSLLPASSVNVMTTDQDKCFQCQGVGHMVHVTALALNVMTATTMVM